MPIKQFLNKYLRLTTLSELNEVVNYFVSILKQDDREFVLCNICEHEKACNGRKCEEFCEGDEVINVKTNTAEQFHWTCMDFDYGDCPVMEEHCSKCLERNYQNFKWKGVRHG